MSEFSRNLWAPWRMQYIDSLAEQADGGCFLCHYRDLSGRQAEHHVLWRTERTLGVLNRFPYSLGHVLVAPCAHVGGLEDLPNEALLELMLKIRDSQRILAVALAAQGFNIGLNLGRCAGAGLPDHLHWHVVPRWSGDTNFMPVLGDVKIMPQALEEVRAKFRAAAEKLGL